MASPSDGATRALFYSRVRASLPPRIVGYSITALGPCVFFLAIMKNTPEVLFVPVITTIAGTFIAFMTVTIKVDQESVVIAFCDVFRRTLPRRDITMVTADGTAGPSGYGFRIIGPGMMVAYVVGGPEVFIEMSNGKSVLASTDRPETLVRVLTEPANHKGQEPR